MYNVLVALLEIYSGILLVFFIYQILQKKKLPVLLVVLELICVGAFFYLRYLMLERKIVLVGEYVDGGDENWGALIENTMTYSNNLAILMGLFLVTQIVFWILYINRSRMLNKKISKKNETEDITYEQL